MKIRSKALHAYLAERQLLNAPVDMVMAAKRAYRKQYKKRWKKARPRKELRIMLTLKQFTDIKHRAREHNIPHTTYARAVILNDSSIASRFILADDLLPLLQVISIATIASVRQSLTYTELSVLLRRAENLLLTRIKNEY